MPEPSLAAVKQQMLREGFSEAETDQALRDVSTLTQQQGGTPPSFLQRLVDAPVATGPDVVGRTKRFLTQEPPTGTHTLLGETDLPGRVVRAVGDLMLPETLPSLMGTVAAGGVGRGIGILKQGAGMLSGPLQRITAGTLAAAGTALATGQDALRASKEFAQQQGIGEGLFAPLRFLHAQRAGQQALTTRATAQQQAQTAFEQAKAAHPQQVADIKQRFADARLQAKAAHKAQTEIAKVAHEQAQDVATRTTAAKSAVDAERVATQIMDSYKQSISAWSDLPSGTKGMLEAVYGKGQERLSAHFEKTMQEVAEKGKGQAIPLSLEHATKLGITPRLAVNPETVMVNAAEAAQKALGHSRTPAYRAVVTALDDADIGNPKARGEYRAGQALITFVDQNKLLEGEVFHPDRAMAGLTQLKRLNLLRARGEGDIFRGPIPEASRGFQPGRITPVTPVSVPPIPNLSRPVLPPVPSPPPDIPLPPGITTHQIPHFPPFAAGVAVELPFALAGHHGYGSPFAAGVLLDAILQGKPVTTQAPLPPRLQQIFGRGPTLAGPLLAPAPDVP